MLEAGGCDRSSLDYHYIIYSKYSLPFPSSYFLTSTKDIFSISIKAVKRISEELLSLIQFYRSIYLLIEIKIAEGGRADLFLAKSLPSGSSTYTAGQLTHFGKGEKCFHKSLKINSEKTMD